MGSDYALVSVLAPLSMAYWLRRPDPFASHLTYTIPPAVLLTLLYRPLFSTFDLYRLCFIVTVCCCPSNVRVVELTPADCCSGYYTLGLLSY